METRLEVDSLGEKNVPLDAYFGIQTARAVENFPVSGIRVPTIFVHAYVMVKKAAAQANMDVGWLDRTVGEAIVKACNEALEDKLSDQFIVDVFQAGAGTSFNMNVNEVLANRAIEILGGKKGNYKLVSPNDHVNMAQSSNDTFPTVLHIASLLTLNELLVELERLAKAFKSKGRQFEGVIKSGRTHLQDAVPVTVGQEFTAYGVAIEKSGNQIRLRCRDLEEIALGGTAAGTAINSHSRFRELAISELKKMTNLRLRVAEDPREALQSRRAIVAMSSALKELALELIRVSNDLRLLSSGPTTGLAEIVLPPVQPGSSIMPGKVNPVMAECLDMIAFQVVGNDLAISLAAQAGQLELNVMTPVMMHNILQSIKILTNFLPVFTEKCVNGITVDEIQCSSYLENNPSLAVFLAPYIGYLEASTIAKEALHEGRSIKEIIKEKDILDNQTIEEIFDPKFLLGKTKRK
jgi:aspartate ammonia-lyase